MELYDLMADPEQSNDLSGNFPEVTNKMMKAMEESHTPSDVWPSPGESRDDFNKRLLDNNIPVRPNNIAEY